MKNNIKNQNRKTDKSKNNDNQNNSNCKTDNIKNNDNQNNRNRKNQDNNSNENQYIKTHNENSTGEKEGADQNPVNCFPPFKDEDRIQISAIQHYSYCPRQYYLIHREQIFEENIFTMKGRIAHEAVDTPGSQEEWGVRIERALPLWSDRLGLTGKADIVEFHPGEASEGEEDETEEEPDWDPLGVGIFGTDHQIPSEKELNKPNNPAITDNPRVPYPVEYKIGKVGKKNRFHSDLQLCAQGICLEEMMGVKVPRGAVFHVSSHKRREVEFTPAMRREVERIVGEIRKLTVRGEIPDPLNDRRCKDCSLLDSCLPWVVMKGRTTSFMKDLFIVDDI